MDQEVKSVAKTHVVTIHVNNKSVQIQGPKASGRGIKDAAIEQGVSIQPNFQLLEELGGGRTRVIGDADEVTVNPHSRFVAIAPDDNS
jgi:hypothetical protein